MEKGGNTMLRLEQSFIDTAQKVTGREIAREVAPRRAGDPAVLIADYARAAETLGWTQRYGDIETIIATAWAWHSAHPEGYDD